MTFAQAKQRLPIALAGSFDPQTHKTIADLAFLARFELDLYEQGEETDIRDRAEYRRVKRYLAMLQALR
jgi:hypothetical protein